MRYLVTLLICAMNAIAFSQTCLDGDCKDGFGMKELSKGDYLGFFKNGTSDRLGVFKNLDGDTQYAYYVNGLIEGTSITTYNDGRITIANYDKGMLEGDMMILHPNINENEAFTYKTGKMLNDRAESFKNNESSRQNCRGNCEDGYGMMLLENNDVSAGYYDNGRVHGLGLLYQADSQGQYYGNFVNDVPNGLGIYMTADGSIYFSEWNYGMLDGLCILAESTGVVTAGDRYEESWREVIYTSN